ncbi:phosphoribosylanthranilate isomerase [Paenibacillus brevis]
MGKETKVKICGLQDVEVLKSMINLPIDYIGFVFARSKRQVSPVQAAGLMKVLGGWTGTYRPESVGVFVNPDMRHMAEVMEQAGLDIVQLHGQESPTLCRELKERFGVRVIKALSVKPDGSLHGVEDRALDLYREVVDGLLVDAYDPLYGGGAGVTFAWEAAKPLRTWAKNTNIPFLVAGGLHPENVLQVLDELEPDGVDVSSGVESNGVKDPVKIAAFVERVKRR